VLQVVRPGCWWHWILLLQRSQFDISIDDFYKAAGNPSLPVALDPFSLGGLCFPTNNISNKYKYFK
jgi:hypothetical protein